MRPDGKLKPTATVETAATATAEQAAIVAAVLVSSADGRAVGQYGKRAEENERGECITFSMPM